MVSFEWLLHLMLIFGFIMHGHMSAHWLLLIGMQITWFEDYKFPYKDM